MSTAPITALAPWFGAKRKLAGRIIAELGPHRAYWEPFCGSMAVLLAKPESTTEAVNDLHGDLINLARVLQDSKSASALYRRLRQTLFCEGWHRECQRMLDNGEWSTDVDRAYLYFCKSWMALSGIAGTVRVESKLCIRYTSTGGNPSVRFHSAITSIPAWSRRLRYVWILNRDAFEVIDNIPDEPGVAIYCDPPYLTKGAKYLHDFDGIAHHKLARLLRRFGKARVVVSYYDHPLLDELYPGWTKRAVYTNKALVNQWKRDRKKRDRKGAAVAPEVLLINGPSYQEGQI